MTLFVKRKDSDGGAEDHYKFGDAIEEDGFLLVFDFNDKKQLARYPMNNVAQWRTTKLSPGLTPISDNLNPGLQVPV